MLWRSHLFTELSSHPSEHLQTLVNRLASSLSLFQNPKPQKSKHVIVVPLRSPSLDAETRTHTHTPSQHLFAVTRTEQQHLPDTSIPHLIGKETQRQLNGKTVVLLSTLLPLSSVGPHSQRAAAPTPGPCLPQLNVWIMQALLSWRLQVFSLP